MFPVFGLPWLAIDLSANQNSSSLLFPGLPEQLAFAIQKSDCY